MNNDYEKNGYVLFRDFFTEEELSKITPTVEKFHENWKQHNFEFYSEKAVNSSYLTGTKYLDNVNRENLFQFISLSKIINVLEKLPFHKPAFMNTQLFFNPVNLNQKNYWHRDPQYHLSIIEQKEALNGPEVIHFRVALKDEPGLELVPETHKRWDSIEEGNVRLEKSGRKNYEDITTGLRLTLKKGDLLVFSANIIHRGIYGNNRLALDILFCESSPELIQYVDSDCLPDNELIKNIKRSDVFRNTIKVKSQSIKIDT